MRNNHRLVLERIVIATAIVQLAIKVVTLLSMIINYPPRDQNEMGLSI